MCLFTLLFGKSSSSPYLWHLGSLIVFRRGHGHLPVTMELDDFSQGSLDDTSDSLGLPRRSESESNDGYHFRDVRYTKLEVISAQQITYILRTILVVVALSVGAAVFSCVVVQAFFTTVMPIPVPRSMLSAEDIKKADGVKRNGLIRKQIVMEPCKLRNDVNCERLLQLTSRLTSFEHLVFVDMRADTMRQARWYAWIMNVFFPAGAILLLVIGVAFLVRIHNSGRENLTHEQMFAVALVFVSLLYFNIPVSLFQMNFSVQHAIIFPTWLKSLERPFRVLKDAVFGPFLAFYVLCNIHSYRILDPQEKIGFRFFAPKAALVIVYSLVRCVAYFTIGVESSEVPFVTAVFTVWTHGRFLFWRAFPAAAAFVLAITILECIIVAVAVWQGYVTMSALRRAPYMIYRTKHVGFRFFIYLNTVFFVTHFVISTILTLGRPIGNSFVTLSREGVERYMFFVPWTHAIGPSLLVLGFVLISAYVNLPHDSLGVLQGWFVPSELGPSSSKWTSSWSGTDSTSFVSSTFPPDSITDSAGWFKVDNDHELNQQIVEPVTYRKREADNAIELKANCFTMQTHVFLFNFAWYVYYYGTPKVKRIESSEGILPFKFTVAEAIIAKSTDTQVLVIDASDRIVVSFKGSTSLRNLRTSFSSHQRRLSRVVPTNIDGQDESERLRKLFGGTYDFAAVHAGFATAYASVAARVLRAIIRLRQISARPVFLTGHSLGGALATICALDVWIKLRVSRRNILVSTFGAPRVGNSQFARVYNSTIALHWRVVLGPDLVTNLPKFSYQHVGKKALLTPHGDLFIDPSALERKLWSGTTAGLGYHRKASYMLAMRSWCEQKHKKTYTPLFFDFPVSDQDLLRFEGAGSKGALLALRGFDVFKTEEERDVGSSRAVKNWESMAISLLNRNKISV